MHPTLFTLGPFTIHSWGAFLAIGFIVALIFLRARAKREALNPDLVSDLAFWVLLGGLLGARIFYILTSLTYFLEHPLEIFMVQRGGLVFYGGFISGALAGIAFVHLKKLSLFKMLDLFAPYVALAQAFGRIGCFLNGCCFGKKDGIFGVQFPYEDIMRHPAQLYSAVKMLAIFFILLFLRKNKRYEGELFLYYLILYSAARFVVEFLRADTPHLIFDLTIAQLISVPVFTASLAAYLINSNRCRN